MQRAFVVLVIAVLFFCVVQFTLPLPRETITVSLIWIEPSVETRRDYVDREAHHSVPTLGADIKEIYNGEEAEITESLEISEYYGKEYELPPTLESDLEVNYAANGLEEMEDIPTVAGVDWRMARSDKDTNDRPHIHLVALRGYPQYYAGNIIHSIKTGEPLPTAETIPPVCNSQNLAYTKGNFRLITYESSKDKITYTTITKNGSSKIAKRKSAGKKVKRTKSSKPELNTIWVKADQQFMQNRYSEYMFTVLREPYSRFISAYGSAMVKKKISTEEEKQVKTMNTPIKRLVACLKFSLSHHPIVYERHMLQQFYSIIGPYNYTHAYNYIGDVYHLNKDMSMLKSLHPLAYLYMGGSSNQKDGKSYTSEAEAELSELETALLDGSPLSELQSELHSLLCAYLQPEFECLGYKVPPILTFCGYQFGDWALEYDRKDLELLGIEDQVT